MYILDDLYYGRIKPSERTINCSQYDELLNRCTAEENALKETMSKDQKELFNTIEKLQAELSAIAEHDAFISGFRIGAKMILDTFEKDLPQILD